MTDIQNEVKLLRSFWLNLVTLILCYILLSVIGSRVFTPLILQMGDFSEAQYYAINGTTSMVLIGAGYFLLVKRFGTQIKENLTLNALGLTGCFLAGMALLACTIVPLYVVGCYQLTEIRPSYDVLLVFIALLGQAVTNEVLFRGLFFRISESKLGTVHTLFGLSLILAMLNILVDGSDWLVFLTTFLLNLVVTCIYVVTRNIWLTSMFYAGWLYIKFLTGLVDEHWRISAPFISKISGPDVLTGGKLGPDASIITLITLGTVFAFLWQRMRQENKIVSRS